MLRYLSPFLVIAGLAFVGVQAMDKEWLADYEKNTEKQARFAKRAGLGITAGGYRGGVQFDKVDQVWEEYKLDADPEMLKDWEE